MDYFAKNLKYLREKCGLNRRELSEKIKVNPSTLTRWENEEIGATVKNAIDVCNYFNVSMADLLGKDLQFDNADIIELETDIIQIPVLGTIKAGIPIESQEDIIEYVDIPKSWCKGGKKFYGLKISGDSMVPKYNENDIVIFEQNDDLTLFNGKDCAIMINGTESTFKKLLVNENGVVLQPYNSTYDLMVFSKEQVENLPIKVVGIAIEKRTRL